jgi:uncharacterized protein (DUF362 family)
MRRAIGKSLDLADCSFKKDARSFVVKPNMCYYWDYTTGQTTDPRFVAALVEVIRERAGSDVEISIVESDASAMKCKYAFRMLGYERLSREYRVKLVNLSKDECERVDVTVGGKIFRLMLPITIRDADVKINVPKIKYANGDIRLTCALKNVFGSNPYPKKFRYHPHLEEAIVAVNKLMRFDLCTIDGNIASGAQPRRLGLVMASKDPVAIDAAAARIAGLKSKNIRYLQLAQKEGIGKMIFIEIGESADFFSQRYPRTSAMQKIRNKTSALIMRSGIGGMLGLG